ncbi:MAG: restriction endonuclease [Proteobacteria bacterium]|nr:MAG: restriction endonuclease [Pseudomonadota bacterium]
MSQAIVDHKITCPYCYSAYETSIDITAGSQTYFEDCQVCCNPIELFIQINEDGEIMTVDIQPGNG